jgi:cellulase/cellobiase CelA1
VARNVGSTLDVAPGDPALTVFHQHALNMQAKNGGTVATPTAVPTTRPTDTPTAMPTVRPTTIPTVVPTVRPTITPTPRPTIVPTVTPTPVPGVACQVHYAVQSQWPGGFTGNITITNKGTATINGWTLLFSFGAGQQLQQGWSAVYTQQGAAMTVSNPSYSTSIAANQAVTNGFNSSWAGSNPIPTSFKLNGTTCSIV